MFFNSLFVPSPGSGVQVCRGHDDEMHSGDDVGLEPACGISVVGSGGGLETGAQRASVAFCLNLGNFLASQGRFVEVEDLLQRALVSGERILGSLHQEVATFQDKLASVYLQQGRYDRAQVLFE